jgi:beta-phosphoglucomutase
MLAAIWDMDGTLVDTAEQHFLAWEIVCQELNRPFTRADFASTFGRRNPEILSQLFPGRFNKAEEEALADRKEALYRDLARKGIELLPGVAALLEGFHQAGFRQAIGSSAPRANLDLILEITGISKYLQAIVSSEDTTRGKPDPQVFLIAAQRLGVTPQNAIVFEDAVAGVEAARAGGMRCVGVTFVGHHSAEKLQAAGADRVVKSLAEISIADVQRLLASATSATIH